MHKYSILTIILSFLSFHLQLNAWNCHLYEHDSLHIAADQEQVDEDFYTIVIDPGHGGKDGGCSGHHSLEKDIVLAIGKQLHSLIKKEFDGVKVILTRDKDEFIPLHERAKTANKAQADLFISIHCNAIEGRPSTNGSETYVLGLHRAEDNLEVAKRENAAILLEEDYKKHYDGFDPSSTAGHIVLSMYQNAHLEQSIHFANLVEHHLSTHAKRDSRGVKQAGFLVLRETTMPSVLIESGFLTNRSEEQFLRDKKGQQKVAESILKAIDHYVILPKRMKNNKAELLANSRPQTTYGIQLISTSNPINQDHEIRKQFDDLEEWKVNNAYKYIIRAGNSRKSAEKRQTEVHALGYKDAFIISWPDKEYTSREIQRSK
jgi:N-acetylmuramoyl-L-alanine amidase